MCYSIIKTEKGSKLNCTEENRRRQSPSVKTLQLNTTLQSSNETFPQMQHLITFIKITQYPFLPRRRKPIPPVVPEEYSVHAGHWLLTPTLEIFTHEATDIQRTTALQIAFLIRLDWLWIIHLSTNWPFFTDRDDVYTVINNINLHCKKNIFQSQK